MLGKKKKKEIRTDTKKANEGRRGGGGFVDMWDGTIKKWDCGFFCMGI